MLGVKDFLGSGVCSSGFEKPGTVKGHPYVLQRRNWGQSILNYG
jgi:hypothetical protein